MPQRLIIACDGTWNDLRMPALTNVARLCQSLLPEDTSGDKPIPQVIYYDDGVGADANGLTRLWKGAVGQGLDRLVYEAYRFICLNYKSGDELFLLGFSRGAYTARSVAGLIGRVGLVPRRHIAAIPSAMALYRQRSKVLQPTGELKSFQLTYGCKPAPITFLGCWDTVGALGIPNKSELLALDKISRRRYQFHDTTLGNHIQRAAHAVAIDEHRREFQPTLMQLGPNMKPSQLREVWFPGDHGCVGGGDLQKQPLANIALRWLVESAAEMGAPLAVDWSHLDDSAQPNPLAAFSSNVDWLYSERARSLTHVPFSALHPSVLQRIRGNPNYRPRNLMRVHGPALNQAANQTT